MKTLELLLTHSFIQFLGWALIYSLWQGGLVAMLLAGALSVLPRQWASIRYWASCSALLIILLLPLGSSFIVNSQLAVGARGGFAEQSTTTPWSPISVSEESPRNLITPLTHSWRQVEQKIEPFLSWLILAWLIGVLFFTARLLSGWVYVQRLSRIEAAPLAKRWQEHLQLLAARIGVTAPVRMVESALVQVPSVIGRLRPIILLPACALTGLSKEQLETIIIHELAHIRRYDYFVNLLQTIIETLLFYHPATWWVSRQIRVEREHACDDLAVAICGDRLLYARALTELERLRNLAAPQLAMAAAGGRLLDRIQRILDPPPFPRNRVAKPLAAGIVLASTMFFLISPMRQTMGELAAKKLEVVSTDQTGPAARSGSVNRNFIETEDSFSGERLPRRVLEISRDFAPPGNTGRSQRISYSGLAQTPSGRLVDSQAPRMGNSGSRTIGSVEEAQDPVTVAASNKSTENRTDSLLTDLQSKDPAVRTRAKHELRRQMKEEALKGANDMVQETNRQVNELSERLMREAVQRATKPIPAPTQKQ